MIKVGRVAAREKSQKIHYHSRKIEHLAKHCFSETTQLNTLSDMLHLAIYDSSDTLHSIRVYLFLGTLK